MQIKRLANWDTLGEIKILDLNNSGFSKYCIFNYFKEKEKEKDEFEEK